MKRVLFGVFVLVVLVSVFAGVGAGAPGDVEWSTEIGSASATYSGVTIIGDTAYAGSSDSNVYALAVSDGSVKWQHSVGSQLSHAPHVVDGTMYVATRDGRVVAIDVSSQSEVWNTSVGTQINPHSGLVVAGNAVYVGTQGGGLYSLSTFDGAERWNTSVGGGITVSPMAVSDRVVVGNSTGIHTFRAADGAHVWSYATGLAVTGSPTLYKGVLYYGDERRVRALDVNGTERWSHELVSSTGAGGVGGPTVKADRVYVSEEVQDKGFSAYDVNGTLLWRDQVNEQPGSFATSAPTVAGDRVYFTGGSDVYAYAVNGTQVWVTSTDRSVMPPTISGGALYVSGAILVQEPVAVFKIDVASSGSSDGTRVLQARYGHTGTWNGSALVSSFGVTGGITLEVDSWMRHGSTQPYTVRLLNGSEVTGAATVSSSDSSVVMVDSVDMVLAATTDRSVNEQVTITAEFNGLPASRQVTVANRTISNIGTLPPSTWVGATFDVDEGLGGSMQFLFAILFLGMAATRVSRNQYIGVGSIVALLFVTWVMGETGLGLLLLGVFYSVFVGIVLADIDNASINVYQ